MIKSKVFFLLLFSLFSCGKPTSWVTFDDFFAKLDVTELKNYIQQSIKQSEINNGLGKGTAEVNSSVFADSLNLSRKYTLFLKITSSDETILKLGSSQHSMNEFGEKIHSSYNLECQKEGSVKITVDATLSENDGNESRDKHGEFDINC